VDEQNPSHDFHPGRVHATMPNTSRPLEYTQCHDSPQHSEMRGNVPHLPQQQTCRCCATGSYTESRTATPIRFFRCRTAQQTASTPTTRTIGVNHSRPVGRNTRYGRAMVHSPGPVCVKPPRCEAQALITDSEGRRMMRCSLLRKGHLCPSISGSGCRWKNG